MTDKNLLTFLLLGGLLIWACVEIHGLDQIIESQQEYIATLEEDFGEEFFVENHSLVKGEKE